MQSIDNKDYFFKIKFSVESVDLCFRHLQSAYVTENIQYLKNIKLSVKCRAENLFFNFRKILFYFVSISTRHLTLNNIITNKYNKINYINKNNGR